MQFFDIAFVLPEVGGELVHFVDEQNDAGLLNAPGRDSERFAELGFFPIVAPVSSELAPIPSDEPCGLDRLFKKIEGLVELLLTSAPHERIERLSSSAEAKKRGTG